MCGICLDLGPYLEAEREVDNQDTVGREDEWCVDAWMEEPREARVVSAACAGPDSPLSEDVEEGEKEASEPEERDGGASSKA